MLSLYDEQDAAQWQSDANDNKDNLTVPLELPNHSTSSACAIAVTGDKSGLQRALLDEASIGAYLSEHPAVNAVQVSDDEVWTLLQYAVCCPAVSSDVVRLLVERDPAAARAQNYHKETPLHNICHCGRNRDLAVIKLLTQQYPEAVAIPGFAGWNPLHEALREGELLKGFGEPPSVEMIKHLLSLWPAPAACLQRDRDGDLPLDHAEDGYYQCPDNDDVWSGKIIFKWPSARVTPVQELMRRFTWGAICGLVDASLAPNSNMPRAVSDHVKNSLYKCSPPYKSGRMVRFTSSALKLILANGDLQLMLKEEPYQRLINHFVQMRNSEIQTNRPPYTIDCQATRKRKVRDD